MLLKKVYKNKMKIIIALDGLDFDKAFSLFVLLAPHVDGFKVNHTLLEHSTMFVNYKGEVFVDCKIWDTPKSVSNILEHILSKGATMTTISTFNNDDTFRTLHQYSEDIKLLGVTYLTSWSPQEQFEITRETPRNMWERHIQRIKHYNFYGMICSADDIVDITSPIKKICPGISFQSVNSGQKRITTPSKASLLGADYAIIGRSITKADHPEETLKKIKKTIIMTE